MQDEKRIYRKCKDCEKEFYITGEEQEFYASKLDSEGNPYKLPERCWPCRQKRRQNKT